MMPPIQVKVELAERSYPVLVGAGLLDNCPELHALAQGRVVVLVTNTSVAPLYAARLKQSLQSSFTQWIDVVLPDGEQHKTLATLEIILSSMLSAHADRKTLVIALGGGVVGDMAGFAAAIYQRGVEFVQIPTTLLAMVDSSVGGKTAVNHPLGKNMIGAFHQPRLVVADVETLITLPDRELSAGLAEVIKHGAIIDKLYFDQCASQMHLLRAKEPAALIQAVSGSCRIKAAVVSADEREQGLRAHLNFGHTFGHAIEAAMGYGNWLHGEAVSAGMMIAAHLSVAMDLCSASVPEQLSAVLTSAGLPVSPPTIAAERMIDLMRIDKKAEQGIPKFILLESIGKATIRHAPEDLVKSILK